MVNQSKCKNTYLKLSLNRTAFLIIQIGNLNRLLMATNSLNKNEKAKNIKLEGNEYSLPVGFLYLKGFL